MKYFIENNDAMKIVKQAIIVSERVPTDEFNTELTKLIKQARAYCSRYRAGGFDYDHLPCGMQDAIGAEVDWMLTKFQIYKLAYKIRKGDATKLKNMLDMALGLC